MMRYLKTNIYRTPNNNLRSNTPIGSDDRMSQKSG